MNFWSSLLRCGGLNVFRSRLIQLRDSTGEIENFMRGALTHFCRQQSLAKGCFESTKSPGLRFFSISSCSASHLRTKIVPLALSRKDRFKMSLAANIHSLTEPLAIPGGSPLRVRNSLSKEKASQRMLFRVNGPRKFSHQRTTMK
jgi:hypothetical protein